MSSRHRRTRSSSSFCHRRNGDDTLHQNSNKSWNSTEGEEEEDEEESHLTKVTDSPFYKPENGRRTRIRNKRSTYEEEDDDDDDDDDNEEEEEEEVVKPRQGGSRFSNRKSSSKFNRNRRRNYEEQIEFERRYSRDLRSRRLKQTTNGQHLDNNDTNGSFESSPKRKNGSKTSPETNNNPEVSSHYTRSSPSKKDGDTSQVNGEVSIPPRRSSRQSFHHQEEKVPSSRLRRTSNPRYSMRDEEDEKSHDSSSQAPASKLYRSKPSLRSRMRSKRPRKYVLSDASDFEDTVMQRKKSLRRKSNPPNNRISNKNNFCSDYEDENDNESGRENGFSKLNSERMSIRSCRNRVPIDRLTYSLKKPVEQRVSKGQIGNLDEYSSDDEYKGSVEVGKRAKYNMRENRTATNRYAIETRSLPLNKEKKKPKNLCKINESDSSDSSSSDTDTDENRFEKRKIKRIGIEKSKMMPANMNKEEVAKSLIRDRSKIGASLADVSPMNMDMEVTFDSVGGISENINSVREMITLPLLYPEYFTKFNIKPPRGVLFYGPPGTGKTLLARAIACEASKLGKKVAFFMRKGADCLSKWVGESERQLRLLFDQAYLMRPSIIFFDEIDGLTPVRSSKQDQIHSSIVSTLLALMDGIDDRGEIIIVGATNRLDQIDPALRRPGRFDRELRFSLPTKKGREEILRIHTKSWNPPIDQDLLERLSNETIGYSGADIKGLCAATALIALQRTYPQVYSSIQKLGINLDKVKISSADFSKAVSSIVPTSLKIMSQCASPLPKDLTPLLNSSFFQICQQINKIFPNPPIFRPKILITSNAKGYGQTTYLGPAILDHLEKYPAYKIDLPTIYSNNTRTPEDAVAQIFHEAQRSVPAILYIPYINNLWLNSSDTFRVTLFSLISNIKPTVPLLILACSDKPHKNLNREVASLFTMSNKEIFHINVPSEEERIKFFEPIFTLAQAPAIQDLPDTDESFKPLPIIDIEHTRKLTVKEEKRLRRKEESRLRELRIFLRDIHCKINREQKFFMFRSPVDTEEVYDYLDSVKTPMDFETMLIKLDRCSYNCAQEFLTDIDLICDNAIVYNSDMNYETNQIICHRAAALRDFAYALVKEEMDTDFEDECQEISNRRKKLTEELKMIDENSTPTSSQLTKKNTTTKKRKKSQGRKFESRKKKKEDQITSHSETSCETNAESHKGEENGTLLTQIDENSSVVLPQDEAANISNDLFISSIQIDKMKLNEVKNDLLELTNNLVLEQLHRIFEKCMSVVDSYKFTADRNQLPTDLQLVMKEFKVSID